MSHKGNCWDNAVAERLFLNLKMERVWQRSYANHAEARCEIAADIVEFHNSQRRHSVLDNLPLSVHERSMAAKKPVVGVRIYLTATVVRGVAFIAFRVDWPCGA
jgi:putative transposase